MINVLAEKMFDVIESKKILLENYTDADLRNISFSTVPNTKTDLRDGKDEFCKIFFHKKCLDD